MRQLLGKASGALAINVVGAGVGLIAHLLLGRLLGAESYGTFAYVFTWIGLLVLVTTFGFQNGLLRYASVYVQASDWARLRGVRRLSQRIALTISLVVAAVVCVVLSIYWDGVDRELSLTVLVATLVLPAISVLRLRSAILRAYGRVAAALLPDIVLREAVVIAVIGTLGGTLGIPLGAPGAMLAVLLGTGVGLLVVSASTRKFQPHGFDSSGRAVVEREWYRTGAGLLSVSGLQLLTRRMDVLLIGILLDLKSAGIYAVASRITDLLLYTLNAVNVVFGPQIARLHAKQRSTELQRLIAVSSTWAVAGAVVVAIPLFLNASWILGLFGPEFVAGAVPLQILLASQIVHAAAGSVGVVLTMSGYQERMAGILVTVVMFAALANYVLIPPFGMVGSAIATVTSAVFLRLFLAWTIWRRLRLLPGVTGILTLFDHRTRGGS